jgi:hypothetical protein
LYRGINEFKKGYQSIINIIKDENGNMIADPQNVLNRWKNSFNRVLNVRGVHDVRQMDIHTAELMKAGDETLHSEIHRLICCIWNKEELPQQWKESIIVQIYKKGDKTDCNNHQGISLLSTAYKFLSNILLARLTRYVNEIIGDHLLWIRFSTFGRY